MEDFGFWLLCLISEVMKRVATEIFERSDAKNHRSEKYTVVFAFDYKKWERTYQTSLEE